MPTLEQRYAAALARIGGTAALLALPAEVKRALSARVDLETKVRMLELVADALRKHSPELPTE